MFISSLLRGCVDTIPRTSHAPAVPTRRLLGFYYPVLGAMHVWARAVVNQLLVDSMYFCEYGERYISPLPLSLRSPRSLRS